MIGKSLLALIVLVTAISGRIAEAQPNTLISINLLGTGSGNGSSGIIPRSQWSPPRIDFSSSIVTPDGRFVVFDSVATDLTADHVSIGVSQVYVRDTVKGTTTLISVNRAGTGGGNATSVGGVISDNGRFVAFLSYADDLVDRDTNRNSDIFVRDLVAGTTTLVSVNRFGTDSANGTPHYSNGAPLNPLVMSYYPLMSRDGRRVVFLSYADDLVDNDPNDSEDIFVRDLVPCF